MNDWLNTLAQFHFLRPYWLLAPLPALLLVALLWRKGAHAGEWKRAIAPHLLAHLVQGSQTRDSKTPLLLLLGAWLLASVAMAGPTWEQLPAAMKKKIDARVIVLDLTLSMLSGDTPPSRLTRAKHKLSDILGRSKEGLTGLVVFAGSAHVVSPLTDDSNTILSLAISLTPEIMPIAGSDPVSAIKEAAEVLKAGGMPEGQVLFIGDDLPENYADALAPLRDTITLSVLAVGTSEGAPIAVGGGRYLKDASGGIVLAPVNHARLREAAALFGGRYTPMTADDSDINLLLADFLNLDDEVRETQREFDIWEDNGGWIALLLLPVVAFAYRRGWLAAWLLPFMLTVTLAQPQIARADTWDSLWKNGDQRGKQSFDQQQWDEAARQFQSPDWKAAALYKSGKFAEAEEIYKTLPGADAQYNRGNALAQQGRLEEALQAYDEALKLNPGLEDAKANRKTVKRLLKQQKKQPSSSSKDGKNGKGGKDDKGAKDAKGEKGDKNGKNDKSDQNPSQNDPSQSQNGQKNDPQDGSNPQDADSQNGDGQQQGDPRTGEQQNGEPQDGQQKPGDDASAEGNQAEKDPQDAAGGNAGTPEQNSEQEQGNTQAMSPLNATPETEDSQAMEQWLRRVPDDPGGLLRRKFYYESRLRRNQENQNGTQW